MRYKGWFQFKLSIFVRNIHIWCCVLYITSHFRCITSDCPTFSDTNINYWVQETTARSPQCYYFFFHFPSANNPRSGSLTPCEAKNFLKTLMLLSHIPLPKSASPARMKLFCGGSLVTFSIINSLWLYMKTAPKTKKDVLAPYPPRAKGFEGQESSAKRRPPPQKKRRSGHHPPSSGPRYFSSESHSNILRRAPPREISLTTMPSRSSWPPSQPWDS